MTTLTAIEYECDGHVTIRQCPECKLAWGTAPPFWYVRRRMLTMDAPDIGWSREAVQGYIAGGLDVAYWNGSDWQAHTPKQYATAEGAFEDYHAVKAKRKDST